MMNEGHSFESDGSNFRIQLISQERKPYNYGTGEINTSTTLAVICDLESQQS